MSLTTILTQFALTVGASLAERIASALSARIKQEPEPEASPVDIAIATKSAVSADREGKIASKVAKCSHPNVNVWTTNTGQSAAQCYACNRIEVGANDAEVELKLRGALRVRRLGDYGPGGE